MAIDASDISDALAERQQGEKVLDSYSSNVSRYLEHKQRIREIDLIYAGKWSMVWPDQTKVESLPKIPNLIQLAAEDHVRLISAGNPSVVCQPEKASDEAKMAAEKRESLLSGYWHTNRVRTKLIPRLAFDALSSGLCALKVLPDFTEPRPERYPVYTRLDPRFLYPDPIFAEGPFIDNAIYAYEEKLRVLEKHFGVSLIGPARLSKARFANPEKARVIEFYDGDIIAVMVQALPAKDSTQKPKAWEWLIPPTRHDLDWCPVAIGAVPTMDGSYRGRFDSVLAVVNIMNRFMTLHLDDAIRNVYSPMVVSDKVQEPEEWGPDAIIKVESMADMPQYMAPPTTPFANFQLMKMLYEFARAGAILPVSRSGDPNESIISAAGVTSTQGQMSDAVRSIQKDTLAPLLEAANSLALCGDEKHADVEKDIHGYSRGQEFTLSYVPSKVIAGNYRNRVAYGLYGGLDEINQNVMLLQNAGKLISERTAREQSPLVEDPMKEEKQLTLEQLDKSILAGIFAAASQPPGTPGAVDPGTVARIRKALQSEGKSLDDAVAEAMPQQMPMAPPAPMPMPSATGTPGAARGQQPRTPLPPMEQLLAGRRAS